MEFEYIDAEHARAKIPGGWIVKAYSDVLIQMHEDQLPADGYAWQVSICFVPDPCHEWQLDDKLAEEG